MLLDMLTISASLDNLQQTRIQKAPSFSKKPVWERGWQRLRSVAAKTLLLQSLKAAD